MGISKTSSVDLERALQTEWVETNVLGSHASSTILGCNTRRHHGLLVARLKRPPGQHVLLSTLDETLVHDDEAVRPRERHSSEALVTRNRCCLSGFRLDPVPSFQYVTRAARILKEVALVAGQNTVLVRYTARDSKPGSRLLLRPLLAYRHVRSLAHENADLRARIFPLHDGFVTSPYDGMPPLFVQVCGSFELVPSPVWYRGFEHIGEEQWGLDCVEDLFSPALLEIKLAQSPSVIVSASTEVIAEDLEELWHEELGRRRRFGRRPRGTARRESLVCSARQLESTGAGRRPEAFGGPS